MNRSLTIFNLFSINLRNFEGRKSNDPIKCTDSMLRHLSFDCISRDLISDTILLFETFTALETSRPSLR